MERTITCPNCRAKIIETYYTEGAYGTVEYHSHCKCGFYEDFAYGSYDTNFKEGKLIVPEDET